MSEFSSVHVENKVKSFHINKKLITKIVENVSEHLRTHHYEVCIQFVGARAMRQLNKKYRHKDSSTDVLAFPQFKWKKPLKCQPLLDSFVKRRIVNPMPLGDVVISLSDAAKNADESKCGLDQEVCFLLVHGILHLVGHDHMKIAEKKIMFAQQRKLMKSCSGLSRSGSGKVKPMWHKCVAKKANAATISRARKV